MSRKCHEVPTKIVNERITADIPDGISWSAIGGTPSRILVNDLLDTPIPSATWTGTEAEGKARWGKDMEKLL